MKLDLRGLATIAVTLVALPAVAHHSFALFDVSRTATVEGTVEKFQWSNPHAWIYLTLPDAGGEPQSWPIEMGAPSGLARQGWSPKTLVPGMKIKVQFHPLRNGKAGGQFLSVTLPDGKELTPKYPPE